MNKVEARLYGISQRKQVEQREEKDALIVSKIQSLPEYQKAKVVLVYYPTKDEVNIMGLVNDFKYLRFPVCVSDTEMVAAKVLGALTTNKFGILEPSEYLVEENVEVVICPLTSFDKEKNRTGFGKGFYDRYLANKSVFKIGVGYACQEVDSIKTNELDIKMDVIVTEEAVL